MKFHSVILKFLLADRQTNMTKIIRAKFLQLLVVDAPEN
jgi:hypothetical protein